MCIVSVALNAHPDFPLVLTHNRDEFFDRPSTTPSFKDDVLAPRDLIGGGTWVGYNKVTGTVAALTNVRCRPRSTATFPERSRGNLVARVLAGETEAVACAAYSRYNLIHGKLSLDAPPELQLSVCAPPSWKPVSHPLTTTGVERNLGRHRPRTHVVAKSNDHGGQMTNATSTMDDPCTWAKVKWLRGEVERVVSGDALRLCSGESGARVLIDALDPIISARRMSEDCATCAAAALPSTFSDVAVCDERWMQAGPFVVPFHREASPPSNGLYGTVSQTVLIQCRSEGCLFFAHREILSARSTEGANAKTSPRSDDDGDRGTVPSQASVWSWTRVPLPSLNGKCSKRKRDHASSSQDHSTVNRQVA